MGADGGSIPDRRDLVKTKAKAEQTDKALLRELFLLCALSRRPLSSPVVLDPIGKLYNKDAVIEYLLDKSKYGDGEQICGHLKGVKDLLTLNLSPNPDYSPPSSSTTSNIPTRAPFVCPLSLREMNGVIPFIALRSCGCVFSDASIRAVIPNLTKGVGAKAIMADERTEEAKAVVDNEGVKEVACPNCGKSFDPTRAEAIVPINPTREVQEVMLEHLLTTRAAAKSKKRKADKVSTNGNSETPTAALAAKIARSSASPLPSSKPTSNGNGNANSNGNGPASLARSVHEKLAEQERKRLKAQEGMSDAVKAMFRSKEGKKSGADDFFGRTFTRYAA